MYILDMDIVVVQTVAVRYGTSGWAAHGEAFFRLRFYHRCCRRLWPSLGLNTLEHGAAAVAANSMAMARIIKAARASCFTINNNE